MYLVVSLRRGASSSPNACRRLGLSGTIKSADCSITLVIATELLCMMMKHFASLTNHRFCWIFRENVLCYIHGSDCSCLHQIQF